VANKKPNPKPVEAEILDDEPRKTDRPSSYTFEVSEQICELMAQGKGLRTICELPGMPARMTVLRWLDDPANKSFRDRYARAREALMDWYSESPSTTPATSSSTATGLWVVTTSCSAPGSRSTPSN
jgi:hypothetical protein